MITPFQIVVNEQQVTKGGPILIINVREVLEYKDGIKTDKIIGFSYTVVCTSNKFEQFNIKVEQAQPVITPEEIEAKGGSVKAKVKGFEGRFYKQNGSNNILFTAKATGIEVLP